MASDILGKRRKAAIKSGGQSSDPIYRMALKSVLRHGVTGAYLDFGGGRARFARQLVGTGLVQEMVVADLLDSNVERDDIVKYVQCDLNADLPFRADAFDVVVALEVIEHLENPRHVMREISRVLRPGGMVFISTPNCENLRSYASLVVRGYHWAFGPNSYPAHITALLRWDLKRCAEEAGLQTCGFEYTNCGGIPKVPHITWQKFSWGMLRGRLFSDNILLEARKPGFS